jgi:hypothetical protein
MSTNLRLQTTNEWGALRGLPNLFSKENGAWWRTRRWWLNTLLWTGLLCGLTTFILFGPQEMPTQADEAVGAEAGGRLPMSYRSERAFSSSLAFRCWRSGRSS